MNKIYKVVWSKALEAYVVTSELAKSHAKNSSRKGLRRGITAALLAAVAVAPVSFGVYAADDTHYVSVNSTNKATDSNYGNDGAKAKNSIAIGPSVETTGEDNIVIGSGELGGQKGVTSVKGNRVLAIGHANYFQPVSDRNGQPVAYRDSAIIGHQNKLLQGDKDDAGGGTPAYQIVHGWKNTLKGSFTGAIGYENEIKNSSRPGHTSQSMALTIGTENTIDATGYYMGDKNRVNTLPDYKEPGENPNTVGADLYVIGRHNIIGSSKGGDWYVTSGHIIGTGNVVYSDSTNVFGENNKVYSGSGIAIGNANKVGIDNAGNLVKNKDGRAIYNPVAVGHGNIVTGNYGVALGVTAESRGEKASAVGSTAYALSDYSAALGTENRAKGYGSVAVGSLNNTYDFDNPGKKWIDFDSGKYSNAIGVMNISKGESSSAIGTKNKALGEGASSFGYLNTAAGGLSSAVGYRNKAEGENSSSFGYLNIATGKRSSALGFRNYATAENSAAIGIYNNKYNVVTRKWEDQTTGYYSVAIGAKNHSAGDYSSALGYENMSGGIAASAVGYRNITDGQSASALGYANIAASTKSSAVGYRNFISGYGAVAVGSENNLNFVKDYQATGVVESGDLSSALGISNTTVGRKSAGIGNSNYALGTKSVGVGLRNYATGYESLAMGHYSVAGSETLDQVKYPVAIGSRAKSTITDAVAIGSFSNTTRDKGDYGYDPSLKKVVTEADITTDTNIGTYRAELEAARAAWQTSVEDAEIVLHKIQTQQYETQEEGQQLEAQYDQLKADSEQKQQAYDAAQKKVGALVGAWQGQMAALSVGDEDTGRTRQITGVAAGSADTDAVNVAQLKAVDRKLAQGAIHYYSVTSDKKAAGSNYDNDGAKADDSMVIGIGSTSEGINSTVIGNNNKLTGNKSIKRAGKVVTVNNSIVAGQNLEVDGYSNTVFATESVYDMYQRQTKVAGDHNTVIGAGNLVGYSEEDNRTYTKLGPDISSNKNVVIGTRQTVSGSENVALGYLTKFEEGADQVTTLGIENTIGSETREGVAIGNHLGINGPQTIAIGFFSGANAESAIVFGSESFANAKNSVAIGKSSVAEAEDGVALGSMSFADREAGMAGYLSNGKTTAEWQATLGAVSVGGVYPKLSATRQITGVAAGTEDTDVVNVAQLKAAAKSITDSITDTTLKADTNALSLDDGKLNLSVKDTAGNEVTGSVDLKSIQSAVDTNTTYTMTGTENAADNTTTISLKDSNGNEQKVTVATKDTNTYTTGGTYDAANKKITFTRNDDQTYDVDLADFVGNVTDTRNTIMDSDTVTVDASNKNADGSINYKLNVKTDGKIDAGNTGIVTGGTVYNETRVANDGNYIKAGNTAGENLIALDKQVGANATNITKLENNIHNMGNRVGELDSKVDRAGAGAAALAALHPLDFDPDDKWDFAAGYGNYSGANAVAIGAYYRPNEDTMFSVGGSFGGGENMVNAGVSVKLGQGSNVTTSRVAMAREISDLKSKNEKMQEENKEMRNEIEILKEQMQKLMAAK